jgi:hypothetical protein
LFEGSNVRLGNSEIEHAEERFDHGVYADGSRGTGLDENASGIALDIEVNDSGNGQSPIERACFRRKCDVGSRE